MADMDAIELHGKILGQKTRGVCVIRQYAADATCGHDHDVGAGHRQIMLGLILTRQIELAALRDKHVASLLSKTAHNCGASHARMAGHKDAFSLQTSSGRIATVGHNHALCLLRPNNVASAARFLFVWGAFPPQNARHWLGGFALPFQIYRLHYRTTRFASSSCRSARASQSML